MSGVIAYKPLSGFIVSNVISGKKDEARRSFDFPAFIRAFGPWPLSRSIK